MPPYLAPKVPYRSRLILSICAIALGFVMSFIMSFTVHPMTDLGAAHAADSSAAHPYGMVDPIAPAYAASYSIYLEQCATCHVALPPAVLPVESWQAIVTDSAHYGITLPAISPFDQRLMLNYLQAYARRNPERAIPYRLQDSAFFGALHPAIALPQPLTLNSCSRCHIAAETQNYTLLQRE